ncbi:MAG TPA: hypothetical protein VLG91_02495 [Streptomyces sp.]|nr:hypothetical protein [Streptomyces sp.]
MAFGRARTEGRLPFELPRSMAAVAASRPDVPDGTEDPVVPYGHGLTLRSLLLPRPVHPKWAPGRRNSAALRATVR